LQLHLQTLDTSIDAVYFTYIYSLLLDLPTVLPILTTYPLPTIHNPEPPLLGTVPLPDDYIPPAFTRDDVNHSDFYKDGKRGTAMTFELAGQPVKKGKELLQNKKEEQKVKSAKGKKRVAVGSDVIEDVGGKSVDRNGAGPSGTAMQPGDGEDHAALLKQLGQDDGDEGNPIQTKDMNAMVEKWGSRLRLRCTDDEIYYRLTGAYQKVSSP
jgi:hypothetical protein